MAFDGSYLIASMGLQVLWSFGLACLDAYALRLKRDLQNPVLVSLFVVGDWVFNFLTSIPSLICSLSVKTVTLHEFVISYNTKKINNYICASCVLIWVQFGG